MPELVVFDDDHVLEGSDSSSDELNQSWNEGWAILPHLPIGGLRDAMEYGLMTVLASVNPDLAVSLKGKPIPVGES